MSDWGEHRLGDLIKVHHGFAFAGDQMTDQLTGAPIVVSIGNFSYTGGFRFGSTRVREFRGDYPKEFELAPGDLLVIMTCQTEGGEILGIPALVPGDEKVYLHNQRIGRVECDESRLHKRFAYYLFLSSDVNRQLFNTASGTKILHTSPSRISEVRVVIPDLRDQRNIAETLAVLDDKIAVNERIAATAQRLMREMYLQAISEESAPKPLGDVVEFHNRKRVPLSSRQRAEIPGPHPYYGAAGVVGHVRDFIFSGPHLLVGEDGSVITAERKPVTQYVWGDFWVNNHAHVLTGKAISTELLAVALQFTDVAAFVTGAAQPKLNMRNLMRLEVSLPAGEQVATLDREIGEVTALVRRRSDESRTLATLRDTLLPQLMSGKLRVRDAEKIVEDAV